MANSDTGVRFLRRLNKAAWSYSQCQHRWVEELRYNGIVAAHPDDGWVDRQRNYVIFCYPDLMGVLEQGVLVALGNYEAWRIVRLIRLERLLTDRWYFEPVESFDWKPMVKQEKGEA